MSDPTVTAASTRVDQASSAPTTSAGDATTGELVSALSQQTAQLVRSELELAKVELSAKAKHAGIGVGMFGGAGLVALYGLGALIATVILALSLVLAPWLAALIVTVLLFAVAGVMALLGKKQVDQATPAKPEETVESVKTDLQTVKEARR